MDKLKDLKRLEYMIFEKSNSQYANKSARWWLDVNTRRGNNDWTPKTLEAAHEFFLIAYQVLKETR
jgi:hypothetical protein